MVLGRMIEAFHKECLKETTKIIITSGIDFVANGTVIQSAGWRSVFNDNDEEKKDEDNATLPKVLKGEEQLVFGNSMLVFKREARRARP